MSFLAQQQDAFDARQAALADSAAHDAASFATDAHQQHWSASMRM